MTLPTALAAPVEDGMMFWAAPRPPRQSWKVVHKYLYKINSVIKAYLVGRSIDGLLGGGSGMNGGHQTFNDIKVVIDDLDQGCQAVGSAASVADNLHVGSVAIFVDAHDEHWGIGGRCRNDDFLGATLKISEQKTRQDFEGIQGLVVENLLGNEPKPSRWW